MKTKAKQAPVIKAQDEVVSSTSERWLEHGLTKAGQRNINVMWERTQQIIAVIITLGSLHMCGWLIIYGTDSTLRSAAFIFITNLAFLVVGTYFQRTNHTKTGGVDGDDDRSESSTR